MQNTVVYLIRHGEVDNPSGLHYGRFRDIGLSDMGFRQLEALGKVLEKRQEKPVALYTSPLRRARESAKNFLPNVPKTILDDLNETDSKGFEGMSIVQERAIVQKTVLPSETLWVEDRNRLADRVVRAIKKARKEHSGEVVALISHGDPIAYGAYRLLYKELSFPPYEEMAKDFFPEKGSGFRFVIDQEGNIIAHEAVKSGVV